MLWVAGGEVGEKDGLAVAVDLGISLIGFGVEIYALATDQAA